MSRQSIVAPIGMITQPSQYGQYKRGALKRARNVVMRAPGVISSMPNTRTYRATIATAATIASNNILPTDSRLLVYSEEVLSLAAVYLNWVTAGASVAVTFPSNWEGGALDGRSRLTRQRGRHYLTTCDDVFIVNRTFQGPLAIDFEGDAFSRMAGLTQPAFIAPGVGLTVNAQAMATNTAAAWRAVIHRTQGDGYEMLSAASLPAIGQTQATVVDVPITVYFAMDHNYQAGDIVEIYRTRTVTPFATDPGDTMRLAVSQVMTAANITAGNVTVRDTCVDDALGVELYSNQGQQGAKAANLDPPAASDMVSFKGHMFYAATVVPTQIIVGPRNAFALLSTDADRLFGIGARITTGTVTLGSAVITAVVNMRGIVPGQIVNSALFAGGSTQINSVTATTITCANNATGGGVGATITILDIQQTSFSGFTIGYTDPFSLQTFALAAGLGGHPFIYDTSLPQRYDLATGSPLTGVQRGIEFIYRRPRVYYEADVTLRVTNGINYSPPLPEITLTANSYSPEIRENRYAWSKVEQPEAVPPLNFGFVGSGVLYRMVATRDALWFFCSDGLFKLSGKGGNGQSAWLVDPVDPNLKLTSRNAVTTLKETVWAYTNRGLVAVSDVGGIQDISLGVIGDQIPGANFADTWDIFMSTDQLHQEVWLTFRTGTYGSGSSQTFIFSAVTKTFVDMVKDEYSTSAYAEYLQSMVLAKAVPANGPDMHYFELDTSTTRMSGPDVRFQPLYVTDPFLLKQFSSCTAIFDGVNAAATLTPSFSDVDYTSLTVNQSAGESRCTWGVPRNAPARAGSIRPGFKMSNVAAAWSFRGLSARFKPGGETTERD